MRECKQFYINGEWVDPVTPSSLDVINPANEEVCAQISMGSEEDVNRAVAAAKTAFATYSQTSVTERVQLLESCVEVYQKYYNDMADAIREEMGAPQALAVHAQAATGIGHLAEAAKILKTFSFEESLGEHRVFKEPSTEFSACQTRVPESFVRQPRHDKENSGHRERKVIKNAATKGQIRPHGCQDHAEKRVHRYRGGHRRRQSDTETLLEPRCQAIRVL